MRDICLYYDAYTPAFNCGTREVGGFTLYIEDIDDEEKILSIKQVGKKYLVDKKYLKALNKEFKEKHKEIVKEYGKYNLFITDAKGGVVEAFAKANPSWKLVNTWLNPNRGNINMMWIYKAKILKTKRKKT